MDVKRNVRRRRMERMRQLLVQEAWKPEEQDIAWQAPDQKDNPLPATTSSPVLPDDPRLQDPEYVWKQKYKNGLGFSRWDGSSDHEPPDEEWVHGWLRRLRMKSVICIVLLALVWGLFQIRMPWAEKGQAAVSRYLSEPLKFESVAAWFEQTFGEAPTFIPTYRPDDQVDAVKASLGQKRTYFAPLQGTVEKPFANGDTGIMLTTSSGEPVAALDDGQVTAAGLTEETGYTVTIRHPNGVESIYGWLDQPRVTANDWVKGGETIGYAGEGDLKGKGKLYYAIKADKSYVNPAEVIAFD